MLNREILFRGKSYDTGKWEYGVPIEMDGEMYILSALYHEAGNEFHADRHYVNPKTIGQFTGVFGNGYTNIFEGDIVNVVAIIEVSRDGEGGNSYTEDYKIVESKYIVHFEYGAFRLKPIEETNILYDDTLSTAINQIEIQDDYVRRTYLEYLTKKDLEKMGLYVIGNIFDNPELL